MAFAVVTSLLDIVKQQLLQQNQHLIVDDRKTVVSLCNTLGFIQSILDESAMKTEHKMVDLWIRDVAMEAESKIERRLRQVYLVVNRGECAIGACEGLDQTLREVDQTLQFVVNDSDLVELWGSMGKRGTNSLVGSSENDFEKDIVVRAEPRRAFKSESEVIVGFAKVQGIILQRILNQRVLNREVIPLVGEGGIGKTTLARRVYEVLEAMTHFDIRAWIVVSQYRNLKEMLVSLLRQILPFTSEISKKDDSELASQLCTSLIGQRYIIVLDDIPNVGVWDAIQECFPDNLNGSRILVTTRFTEVARHSSADPHFMKYLSDDTSWALFMRKICREFYGYSIRGYQSISLGTSIVPENLVSRIVQQCHGLPLAIVVIAGLLNTAKDALQVCEDVAKTLEGTDRVDDRISTILSLGYNHLPGHLKVCFLYFGVFPKGSAIHVKNLINLWAAEGFLKSKKNKSLEEVGESYLCDLVNRSLVQINELSIDGKIKSCKIHDRLHEICVREAKGENTLCILDENHAPRTSRWISFQTSHWPITRASYGNNTSNETRSILYFGEELHLSKCKLVYPCFELLRVLDLSLVKFSHGVPGAIADLAHLRYLALSTIGSLHRFQWFKLRSLQTLIVGSWMKGYPLHMPCDIMKLPRLRHLYLEKRSSQYLPSSVQKNLQTLFWFKVASLDQNPDFGMVPNLKQLGIYIEGELAPSCLDSLVHLQLLEKLKIEVGRIERFHLPTAFPPNLKKLTLRYTYLPWEKMDIIGKLSCLKVLKLKDFAFYGPEWEPKMGGFTALKVLLIARSGLKCWKMNAYHFPLLERMVLRYCWDLKEVPNAFAEIETLKLIVLDSCYSSLVDSANRISSENMLLFQKMADDAPHVRYLGTKVDLPNNEIFEEEEENVDIFEEECAKSSGEDGSKISEEVRLKTPNRLSKALKKIVSKELNWKMSKALKWK